MPAEPESRIPSKSELRPVSERRADRRVPLSGSLAMARVHADGSLSVTEEVSAIDLTGAGIRLILHRDAKPGDQAVLQLFDSSGSANLVGLHAIHCGRRADGGWVLGARFIKLSEMVVCRSLLIADRGLVDLRHRPSTSIRAVG